MTGGRNALREVSPAGESPEVAKTPSFVIWEFGACPGEFPFVEHCDETRETLETHQPLSNRARRSVASFEVCRCIRRNVPEWICCCERHQRRGRTSRARQKTIGWAARPFDGERDSAYN